MRTLVIVIFLIFFPNLLFSQQLKSRNDTTVVYVDLIDSVVTGKTIVISLNPDAEIFLSGRSLKERFKHNPSLVNFNAMLLIDSLLSYKNDTIYINIFNYPEVAYMAGEELKVGNAKVYLPKDQQYVKTICHRVIGNENSGSRNFYVPGKAMIFWLPEYWTHPNVILKGPKNDKKNKRTH